MNPEIHLDRQRVALQAAHEQNDRCREELAYLKELRELDRLSNRIRENSRQEAPAVVMAPAPVRRRKPRLSFWQALCWELWILFIGLMLALGSSMELVALEFAVPCWGVLLVAMGAVLGAFVADHRRRK